METIDNTIIRNEAAVAALAFGAVSGGCCFLEPVIAGSNLIWLSTVISLVKLVGLIWLMRFMMLRLRNKYEGVRRRELLRYGVWISLFSALITGICSYLCVEYVFSQFYTENFNLMWESLAPMMDSNSNAMMSTLESNYALISLVSVSLWCFIYGWILSGILSSRCAPASIFDKKEEDDD